MEAFEQIMAAGGVLALLAGTLWWLRRRGIAAVAFAPRRARRHLESLERLALGPQHVLHLVRFRDCVLLVAASPGACVLLEQMPADAFEEARVNEVRR